MSMEQTMVSIIAIVENQVAGGAHWGSSGSEIAKVAVKRWKTYSKRHPKTKRVQEWERVADLVKGFQAHFEAREKPWNIAPSEWKWLAESLVPILAANNLTETSKDAG